MFVSVYVMVLWRSLADKIISKTKFSGYIHMYIYICKRICGQKFCAFLMVKREQVEKNSFSFRLCTTMKWA